MSRCPHRDGVNRCLFLAVCQGLCRVGERGGTWPQLSPEAERAHAAGLPIARDGTPADPEKFGVIAVDVAPPPSPRLTTPTANHPWRKAYK